AFAARAGQRAMPLPRGGPALRPLISTALACVSQFTTDLAGAIEQEDEHNISMIIIQFIEGEPRNTGVVVVRLDDRRRAPRDLHRLVLGASGRGHAAAAVGGRFTRSRRARTKARSSHQRTPRRPGTRPNRTGSNVGPRYRGSEAPGRRTGTICGNRAASPPGPAWPIRASRPAVPPSELPPPCRRACEVGRRTGRGGTGLGAE